MNNLKKKAVEFFKTDKFSSAVVTALVIALVMVFNALLFTVAELFGLVFSYTPEVDYSLTGASDELFADAISENKKVTIYFCMTENEVEVHSTGREVYTTAKNFAEKYPDFIELDFINIITRQDKDGNYIDLSKYKTDSVPIYKTSVIFECGDNHRVLTDTYTAAGFANFFTLDSSMYITSYNGEEIISAMISWVTEDEHKKAYFTQRHGEMADLSFTNLLTAAGYELDLIDLRKNSVPDDADLLIISNPTSDFEASKDGSVYTELDKIKSYMARGGNLYVALDPYVKTLTAFEDFLAEFGISFMTTETAEGKKIRNMVKDPNNAITSDGFTLVCEYADGELASKIADKASAHSDGRVIVREVSALELSGAAKPILNSSSSAVLEAEGRTVSDSGSYTVAAYSEVANETGGASRIFVVPSIYLAVSDSLVSDSYSNKDFVYSVLEGLFGAGNLPYGCKPIMYSSSILQNLTMGTARLYTALAMLVPAAIAIVGTVVLVRRKNR